MAMRKKLRDKAESFRDWLENFGGAKEGRELFEIFARMMASLPGGDEFEDVGYEGYAGMGWKEYEELTELLQEVDSKQDVQDLAEFFLSPDDEDEDEDEED